MVRDAARIFDEYLVASARTGDRKALDQLAGRWQRKLVAHAWRLIGDPEGAREAAQAAWVEIVRGLHRLHDDRAFPAWAYRIVSRRCAALVRAAQHRRRVAEAVGSEPEAHTDDGGAELDADRLRAAIRGLSPEQRSVVALFYFEDLAVAEVAVALDVPAGTVKTRLMHARRKLRAVLEGEA